MNESNLTKMKILVERVVRPVRAGAVLKRKMREELLAHVSAVFEEEAMRVGDEGAALDRTAQRFGDPAELTGQMQHAVPKMDLVERFFDWASFQPGESSEHRAVRYTMFIESYALLFLAAMWILSGPMSEWTTEAAWLIGSVLVGVGYMMFTLTFLEYWMRRSLHEGRRRSWLKPALALVSSSIVPILGFGVWGAVSGISLKDCLWMGLLAIGSAVVMVAASWCLAHVFADRNRYHEEWASLQID